MKILSGLMWFCWGVSAMALYAYHLVEVAHVDGQQSVECHQDRAVIKPTAREVIET